MDTEQVSRETSSVGVGGRRVDATLKVGVEEQGAQATLGCWFWAQSLVWVDQALLCGGFSCAHCQDSLEPSVMSPTTAGRAYHVPSSGRSQCGVGDPVVMGMSAPSSHPTLTSLSFLGVPTNLSTKVEATELDGGRTEKRSKVSGGGGTDRQAGRQ